MANGIDRLLLGGAFVLSGLAHRRLGRVDQRVDTVEQEVQRADERPAAPAPEPPGMPLPTGYGLQVTGPDGEDLQIPVCLPPGFELGSLVLRPSFLPHDAVSGPREAERLDESSVHVVYGGEQPYSARLQGPDVAPSAAAPRVEGYQSVL